MIDSTSSVCSILHIPDEVLTEIILYLNAGERIALGNTSERFYHLLFENRRLIRDLDFTQGGSLTCGNSFADIERYFKTPERSEPMLKVDSQNVWLPSSKLENLFDPSKTQDDLYTQTVRFETIVQLGIFLGPFVHVECLSIEWPGKLMTMGNNLDKIRRAWHASLSRLKYLSVTVTDGTSITQFLACLHLCQELKELRIIDRSTTPCIHPDLHNVKLEPLKNLEIVVFSGRFEPHYQLYYCITDLLAYSNEWIKLTVAYSVTNGFYFQKSAELSEILGEPKSRYLSYDSLLEQVLTKTHEIEAGDLRCLLNKNGQGKRSLFQLKMEEIKLLINAPKHEIHHLELDHNIHSDCMVHLVASAFPNLTELVLTNIVKITGTSSTPLKKRLRKRGDAESEDYRNVDKDSSFKMLVENTPCLKSLTIIAVEENLNDNEIWDLDALSLIAGWKNLRSLCLKSVPIRDGLFLVAIGKQCVYLEKLELHSLGSHESCSYLNELCQMLTDCQNLRDLKISERNIGLRDKLNRQSLESEIDSRVCMGIQSYHSQRPTTPLLL